MLCSFEKIALAISMTAFIACQSNFVLAAQSEPKSDNSPTTEFEDANSSEIENLRKYVEFDPEKLTNFEVVQKQQDYEMDLSLGDPDLPGANGPMISAKTDEGFSVVMSLVSKGTLSPEEVLERNESIHKAIQDGIKGQPHITPLNSIGPSFSKIEERGQLEVANEKMPYLVGKCPERPGAEVLFGIFQPKDKNLSVLITATQPGSKFNLETMKEFLESIQSFTARRDSRPHWGEAPTQASNTAKAKSIANLAVPLPAHFKVKEVNSSMSFIILENLRAKQVVMIRSVYNHRPNAEEALEALSKATKPTIVNSQSKHIPLRVKIDFTKLIQGAPYKDIKLKSKMKMADGTLFYFTGTASNGNQAFVGFYDAKVGHGLDVTALQLTGTTFDLKDFMPLIEHIKGPGTELPKNHLTHSEHADN